MRGGQATEAAGTVELEAGLATLFGLRPPAPVPAGAPRRAHVLADDRADDPKDARTRRVMARRADLLAWLQASGGQTTTQVAQWLGCVNPTAIHDLNALLAGGLVSRREEMHEGRGVLLWRAV